MGRHCSSALVEQHLKYANSYAWKLIRAKNLPTSEADEFVAAARRGLWQASLSYDESRGVPFTAWAAIRMKGEIADEIRRLQGRPDQPRPQVVSLTALEGRIHGESAAGVVPDTSDDGLIAEEQLRQCFRAIDKLPPRHRRVLIDGVNEVPQAVTAEALGVDFTRVSQLCKAARQMLREAVELDDF
jgi:RNA polymerase sigma factor (sigma-70 family)